MSNSSAPISAERFALAIADLPLTNVYTKAAEIRNSMSHLVKSNEQLRPDAELGDRDCAEAIEENAQVIGRMQERLELLKHEVERRGYTWHEEAEASSPPQPQPPVTTVVDGDNHNSDNVQHVSGQGAELVNGTRESNRTLNSTRYPVQANFANRAALPTPAEDAPRDEDEAGLHL